MRKSSDSLPNLDRFLQALDRSRLIDRERLRQVVEQASESIRSNSKKLAAYLVEMQFLTHFQAAKLLKGTWQGLVLGPYQILAPLGQGGMGRVYLARNVEFETKKPATHGTALVALKVLPPKRAKEEHRTLARFLREMDMCRRVLHPHLTQTYDAGDIKGVYYIAMEYIRGTSLSQLVKSNGPLLVPRVARIFSEVAAGLTHAHDKGLIHRDLKPSNIMVTPNGHAKVLDLGLAIAVDEDLPKDKTIVGGQGYVVGTMDYISPEQVDDPIQVDIRADLYSLGCSMYFAMTGMAPFPGGTKFDKMKRHRKELATPISDLNPMIPVPFSQIIEKLMEKNPSRRFPTAQHVREALLPWIAGDPELPMDTDPLPDEAQAIELVEKEHIADPDIWWDSVPGISFDAAGKQSSTVDTSSEVYKAADNSEMRESSQEAKTPKRNPFIVAILVVAGMIGLLVFLELIRR